MEKIDGKTNDLSGFGVDFRNWINVQCIVHNKNINILVNQQLVYQGIIKQPIRKVVGTCISFIGSGEIKKFDIRKL